MSDQNKKPQNEKEENKSQVQKREKSQSNQVKRKIYDENICTFCDRNFNDTEIIVDVTLITNVIRVNSSGIREPVENASMKSREILCETCFDKFSQVLSLMNSQREALNVSE